MPAKKPKTLLEMPSMLELCYHVSRTIPYRTPQTVGSFFKFYKITLDSSEEEYLRVLEIIKKKPSIRREILNDICKRTGYQYGTLDKKVYKDKINLYDADDVDRWVAKLGLNKVSRVVNGKEVVHDFKPKNDSGIFWQPDALPGEPYIPGKQTEFLQANEDIVLVEGGKGKLSLKTPIPTVDGWTTMGEIRVGDRVFDESGKPCNVLELGEITVGDDCYELEFSDHSKIIADHTHLWWTQTASDRTRGIGSSFRTTKEIHNTANVDRGRRNHTVLLAKPLSLPWKELPIDPWLLGYWLGNGMSGEGRIVVGSSIGGEQSDMNEVLANIKKAGYESWIVNYKTGGNAQMVRIKGFSKALRHNDLINNKHIPKQYFRASEYQRLQLLNGLLDADGGLHRMEVEFDNSNVGLRDGVFELACSLGMKCWKSERRGKLNGVNKKMSYRVRILPTMQVFSLSRKAKKIVLETVQPWSRKFRYITSVKRVPSVPVRCITVDTPLHVFLAGEAMIPTRNSGKSDLLIFDSIRPEKLGNEKYHCVIFRREYKRLEELIGRAKLIFLNKLRPLRARWEDKHNRMIFPSGAWIAFHNCQNLGDEEQYQGWEITDLKFDQIEEFAPSQIDYLMLLNRSGDLRLKCTVRATANPLGRYHTDIKKRFIDGFEPSKTYYLTTVEDGIKYTKTYRRIHMTVFDNPHLSKDKSYIATLATEPNLIKRKAMLKGDWDVVIGQFFNTYFRDVHVLKNNVDLDPSWRRVAGLDYGNVKSMQFLASDYLGNIYGEWEFHVQPTTTMPSGMTAEQFGDASADFMLDRNIGDNLMVIGDTNMWAATGTDVGTTRTPAQIIQACWKEKFLQKARKTPILIPVSKRATEEYRWRLACNEALRSLLTYEMDEAGKVVKQPKVYWMPRCANIIETLPTLKADPNNPEDIEDGQDDHAFDAFKMGMMVILPSKQKASQKTAKQIFEEQLALVNGNRVITTEQQFQTTGDYRIDW